MKFRIFDDWENLSRDRIEYELSLLPDWRREKALRYRFARDQFLCSKAYLLLKELLAEEYGLESNPIFDYGKHGKPVLRGYPKIHFNLSHCHKGILCVVDNRAVGCDIEEIPKQLDMDLCRYCFNDGEIEQILTSGNPNAEFASLWTRKESLLKLTGEGLCDDMKTLLQDKAEDCVQFDTVVVREKGYVYTLCYYWGT